MSCLNILKKLNKKYKKWLKELKTGFSICLYGYGEKKDLIEDFVNKFLKKDFEVKFFVCFKNEIQDLKVFVPKKKGCLILFGIENLSKEGILFLEKKCKKRNFVFLATSDNVKSSFLISRHTAALTSLIWHHVSTKKRYETKEIMEKMKGPVLKNLSNILNCISKNTKKIFQLILQTSTKPGSVLFETVFQKCKKNLLIINKTTLRTHLTEFIDHSIIKITRNKKGEEILLWDPRLDFNDIQNYS